MSLVIDASVVLAWSFEDERTPPVLDVLDEVIRDGAMVPVLWPIEIANGLRSAIRRRRIDTTFRDQTLADLAQLPIAIDTATNDYAWSSVVALADKYGLTPYDAAYLELAGRKRVPLATLDGRLREAAAGQSLALRGR